MAGDSIGGGGGPGGRRAGGRLRRAIFLIDKGSRHKPGFFAVPKALERPVSAGSTSTENRIAERYPWLQGAGDIVLPDGGSRTNGFRLGIFDEKVSPVTFVALFPHQADRDPDRTIATAPVTISNLLLAIVYLGPDGQVYWAQRLQG